MGVLSVGDGLHLGLCFTGGVSLRLWHDQGLLDREVALYRRMTDKGIKVTFFTYGDREDLYFTQAVAPITVVPFSGGRWLRSSPYLAPFWLALCQRRHLLRLDVVKTNQMLGSWAGVLAKALYHVPLVVRCGFDHYRFAVRGGKPRLSRALWYWTSRTAYRAADRVVLTSEEDRRFVQERFGVPADRIRVIPNAIDTSRFRPLQGERFIRRVLFVGRLEPQKNLFALLDAVKDTDLALDIIGEGALREEIEWYVAAHSLPVRLLGRVPNRTLPEVMNRYPVLVLPSRYEGNPKVLLEAMSCGLAVVGANTEGINEVIRHGENGYLCGTDPASIRGALLAVLDDDALRSRLGARGRDFVIIRHELDRIVRDEIDLYQQLVAHGR